MLTVNAIGRVTKDLEVQYSKAHEPYVRFNFVVNKGYGENAHPVYLQCWVFGTAVERLVKARVGKGSLLHITGDLDITKIKKDQETEVTIPKIIVMDWGYVPIGKPKANDSQPDAPPGEAGAKLEDFGEIDCNEDDLPF
jgi:single-stranded DNA-binding protein